MHKKTIERLQATAGSWRGSEALVSVARADALALGLDVPEGRAVVQVPAPQFCAAAGGLAVPADDAPANARSDGSPGEESGEDKPAPTKKTRKR